MAIQDMDLEELRAAQLESGNNSLSILDLEVFTPCHPDKGLSVDSTKDFVIIHHHPARIYYAEAYDETGTAPKTPPLCQSWDGITGEGSPGGECKVCPLGQFKGDCKPVYVLYGLDEDSFIPTRIMIPRTSLQSRPGVPPKPKFFANYALTVRKRLTSFMVRIGVRLRGPGKAGKVVTFEKGADIDPAVSVALIEYAAGFKATMGFPALQAPLKQLEDPTKKQIEDNLEENDLDYDDEGEDYGPGSGSGDPADDGLPF
jgi:hypothetical protein